MAFNYSALDEIMQANSSSSATKVRAKAVSQESAWEDSIDTEIATNNEMSMPENSKSINEIEEELNEDKYEQEKLESGELSFDLIFADAGDEIGGKDSAPHIKVKSHRKSLGSDASEEEAQDFINELYGLNRHESITSSHSKHKPTEVELSNFLGTVKRNLHTLDATPEDMKNSPELSLDNFNTDSLFTQIVEQGLKRIWTEDADYQRDLLRKYVGELRGVPEDVLDKYIDHLESLGAFVNPDNDYMADVFGSVITDINYGIYDSEICRYTLRLMLPIRFLDNTIQGFVGYSPVDSGEGNDIKYLYPKKVILKKANVLFCTPEQYEKALQDGYICLTDGLFDAISLNVYGINAASLCGSAITNFHKVALRPINTRIIVPDNDIAGVKLQYSVKSTFKNSRALIQSCTKDMDDYLKDTERREELLQKFDSWKRMGFIGDLRLDQAARLQGIQDKRRQLNEK